LPLSFASDPFAVVRRRRAVLAAAIGHASAAPSGLELFFDSLTQGGTRIRGFALGYCLPGFQPLEAVDRLRQRLRSDSRSFAFIRG
jgi:hypothetical protein